MPLTQASWHRRGNDAKPCWFDWLVGFQTFKTRRVSSSWQLSFVFHRLVFSLLCNRFYSEETRPRGPSTHEICAWTYRGTSCQLRRSSRSQRGASAPCPSRRPSPYYRPACTEFQRQEKKSDAFWLLSVLRVATTVEIFLSTSEC